MRGLAFIMYTRDVRERVRDSWVVTERKQGLIAKVRFGVRPDGKVFNVELIQRSGDSVFDQSVLRAVLRAGPLPPPPQKYAHAFAEEMVEITFGGDQ